MYTSIDDVTSIDSDKAGEAFADFLRTAGQTALLVSGLTFAAMFILAIVVAKKAGYSGWWGAIGVLFPPIGVVLLVLFALLKWPSLKERDEALGILDAHNLTLPSRERAAVKEAERKRALEDDARKRMERAQADREKAEAERARFQAAEAKRAAELPSAPAAHAAPGEAPAETRAAAPASAAPAPAAPDAHAEAPKRSAAPGPAGTDAPPPPQA